MQIRQWKRCCVATSSTVNASNDTVIRVADPRPTLARSSVGTRQTVSLVLQLQGRVPAAAPNIPRLQMMRT